MGSALHRARVVVLLALLLTGLLVPATAAHADQRCMRAPSYCTEWNPTAGPVGTKVTVTGTNWQGYTPGRTSDLTWAFAPNTVAGTITITEAGTFSATVTVPQGAPTGKTSLHADGDFTLGGVLGFEVTAVPGSPPQSPKSPTFVQPKDGQTLDADGGYIFTVQPVDGASGYLWGFFQGGEMVWENYRDERELSGTEYSIQPGSPAHERFEPGEVEVWVRALVDGQWTDARIIRIHLEPKASEPVPPVQGAPKDPAAPVKPVPAPPVPAPVPAPDKPAVLGDKVTAPRAPAVSPGKGIGQCSGDGVSEYLVSDVTPIIFVHGIRSTPEMWTSSTVRFNNLSPLRYVENRLGNSATLVVQGVTFDWQGSAATIDWVTAPTAAPLLREAIECVARETRRKVVIVGHSMGGLVAKKAVQEPVTGYVAAVFTIGSPLQGSYFASDFGTGGKNELLSAFATNSCTRPSKHKERLEGAISQMSEPLRDRVRDLVCGLERVKDSPGVIGMREGTKEEAVNAWHGLPNWPRNRIMVTNIAGDSRSGLSMWPLSSLLESYGDMVSTATSQRDGQDEKSAGQVTITCTLPLDTPDSPDSPYLFAFGYLSDCFHLSQTISTRFLDAVVTGMQGELPTDRPTN